MSGALYRAWFLIRTRVGPIALFGLTVSAMWWAWQDVGHRGAVIGFAQGIEVRVAPLYAGRVESVAVEIGQTVQAGQIIATLDPSPLDAEIRLLDAERSQVSAGIAATEAQARQDAGSEARRLATDLETAQVAVSTATAEARSKAAELKAVSEQRRKLAALIEQRMASAQDAANLDVRCASLRKQTEEAERALTVLRERVEAARKRAEEGGVDLATVSAEPLRQQLEGIERRMDELRARRSALVLRSPTAGQVSAVLLRAGEVAAAGAPVATVVGTAAGRVVACVSESQALSVRVGDLALLWPKGRGGEPLRGRTVSLGPIVDEVPARCRAIPSQPAWGRDVVILLDEAVDLVPGQAFDVRLGAPEGADGEAVAAPATDASRAMVVPAVLRERSRFEPSALVWVAERSRYVVVSDDTGQKDAADHAPWLFTMDAQGRVDAEPVPVDGVDEVNDLEGIADAGGGALWVLSSQSRSKKGKRPASRQLFARLEPQGGAYRVDGAVHLAELLAELSPTERAELGIDDMDALNIEGLTRDSEGLLLGLKGPVDAEGRAPIWRLRRPETLVRGGTLHDAGLEPWGRVGLEVTAEGKTVPGGIAELLALPDGRLLIAATASGIKTQDQTGSLWIASREGGQLTSRRVQEFPGRKPEGLALSPEPGRIMVVFDADQDTPGWMDLPWPR